MSAMQNHPYQAYRRTQVETATREELLFMLYRGALNFLGKARSALEEEDIENSHYYLVRTQNILSELMSSVDLENGGQMAQNLFNLYEYMHRQLVDANLKKSTGPVDEVEKMLQSLLEAWRGALNTGEVSQEPEAATSEGKGSAAGG